MKMTGVPYVIERDEKNNERMYDLFSRILKDNIVFVCGHFNDDMANSIVAQLLFLESVNKDKSIYLYINSPGGSIVSMYGIYDTMNYIANDIVTIGFGTCASAASFILAAGTKGKRFALPNTEIMIHELSSGFEGKATDIKINYKQSERMKQKMAKQYAEMTGQKVSKLLEDMERDLYMTSEEAKDYGLIDIVEYKRVI